MECLPTADPLYSYKANGLKTEFHAAYKIEYTKLNDPDLKWKVHLGDIIAFSCKPLTDRTVQDFSLDHYEKPSPHWKIGVVTLLKQEQSPKSQSISIQLRILEKIMDTPFSQGQNYKKLRNKYRPFRKNDPMFQIPRLLIKTEDYQVITPDQVLPFRIHILDKKLFMNEDKENKMKEVQDDLNLHFFVANEYVKASNKTELLTLQNPDVWLQLNYFAHKDCKKVWIPAPLRESWSHPIHNVLFNQLPELLSTLVHGYKNYVTPSKSALHMKRLNKNWNADQAKADTGKGTVPDEQKESKKKQSNKRRAPSSKQRSGSKKRVRIQVPDEGENANPSNVPSKPSTSKSTIAKTKSILTSRKRKTTSPVRSKNVDESTASTSNSTASTSPRPRASPKRRKRRFAEVKVDQSCLLRRMNGRQYYSEMKRLIDLEVFADKAKIKPENQYLDISVGQIVAVRVEGEASKSSRYNHNNIIRGILDDHDGEEAIQWSPAQVVSAYCCGEKRKKEWLLRVRWFSQLEEMEPAVQEKLLLDKEFASTSENLSNSRVIESMQLAIIDVESVLPIHVQISSSTTTKVLETHEDGLPLVRLACKHLLTDKGKIKSVKKDWDKYQDHLGSLPSALHRGLEELPKTLQSKTLEWIQETYGTESNSDEESDENSSVSSQSAAAGSSNDEEGEDSEDENDQDDSVDTQPLEVSSLASKPLYARWNCEFHDGVRLDVDRESLVRGFSPKTRQWTVKVGFVVPIRLDKESVPIGLRRRKSYWHPFVDPWLPAQIVSIYKKKATNEWMMQVRWFHRFRDLLQQQKAAVKNFDKPYVVFETEEYTHLSLDCVFPGRIIMTSSDVDSWAVETSFLTGLPLIPRLCAHFCLDEEIDSSRDWTNYDLLMKSMPQPLSRGLMLDPINRENKDWILMLSRYYKAAIVSRGIDPDESLIKKWEGVEGRSLNMDFEEYDDSTVQISTTEKIFSSKNSPGDQFFGKVSLTIPSQNLVEPSKVEKRSKEYVLSCKVGDVVCFYDAAAAPRPDYVAMKHLKHLWHPYRVPWCFGQILCIHQSSKKNSLRVEVRRFLRDSDLPQIVRSFAPAASDTDREELFESDIVLEVPASYLLGTADIFFSGFEKAVSMNEPSSHEASRTSFRCKYFFHHKAKIIQPIAGSSFTPETWFRECRCRSLQFSTWAGKYSVLHKESTPLSPRLTAATVVDLLESTSKAYPKSMIQLESSTPERTMYLETKIHPNWSNYQDWAPIDSSRGSQWKIQVGDFVAVQCDAIIGKSSIHSFIDNWRAAQILAIFTEKEKSSNNNDEQLQVQVRHLKMKEAAENEIPFVENLESIELLTIRAEHLRCPLLVCKHGDSFDNAWKKAQQQVPSIPCWGSHSLYASFEKSLENSSLYTSDGINEICSKIDNKNLLKQKEGGNDRDSDGSGVAWTSSKPFHIDLSQLRTFYESMKLIPSKQMYAVCAKDDDPREPWSVQMGDVVLIRCEGARRYPMDCGWSVAEIVTIFKDFDSTDALERDQHANGDRAINAASLKVEIRWLYERHDLKRDRTFETESSGNYEEVFESDHVDVVDGEEILCPAKLFSDPSMFVEHESFRGIPVNQYVCKRFWSTKRKSLIPCGKLEGRQERGWLYSRNFPQEAQEKYSAANLKSNGIGGREEETDNTWHENMNRVISKLTLLDASTGAYERGEGLIGREKELNELLSFFRAAIRGTAGTGGVKSSLFLAGSPGVGKTACVRAALAQLRKEQSTGTIPKFNLISLNGMELRHPFEAYGKFWEALTGLKHVGTHEAAAARLTRYFTTPIAQGAKQTSNPVTVLLLDEIDYLMTEKQTVLYDFFDWPKRAAELRQGRRLVVVGISNTLNLADQLLQSVRSRLGSENKLLFKSYDLNETIAILDAKMKDASPKMKIFEKDAILLASKKTAGLSGDIRKVFKICRDAAKLVLRKWEESDSTSDSASNFPTVKIGDVQKASLQSLETALKVAVSFSSPYQALLLVSIASLKRATGREGNFDIKDIMMKMEAISGACGQAQYSPPPSFARTMDLLTILAERGLVCLTTARSTMVSFRANKGGSGGAWPLVSLMVGEDQLSHGLKKTRHKELCDKNIPSMY